MKMWPREEGGAKRVGPTQERDLGGIDTDNVVKFSSSAVGLGATVQPPCASFPRDKIIGGCPGGSVGGVSDLRFWLRS